MDPQYQTATVVTPLHDAGSYLVYPGSLPPYRVTAQELTTVQQNYVITYVNRPGGIFVDWR